MNALHYGSLAHQRPKYRLSSSLTLLRSYVVLSRFQSTLWKLYDTIARRLLYSTDLARTFLCSGERERTLQFCSVSYMTMMTSLAMIQVTVASLLQVRLPSIGILQGASYSLWAILESMAQQWSRWKYWRAWLSSEVDGTTGEQSSAVEQIGILESVAQQWGGWDYWRAWLSSEVNGITEEQGSAVE